MADKLFEYNLKRDFNRTTEPEGEELSQAKENTRLRFVVQHHAARKDHFDFRLEWNGSLLSWAVPKGPSYNPRDKRLAAQVEDHPLEYRNFEGTIPKGEYGGGIVMLWDEGTWEPAVDVGEGLRIGSLKFTLLGKRLKGKWALIRMKAKEGEENNNWLLLKEKDEFASDCDGISEQVVSIRTGRTMDEIQVGADEKIIRNPFDKTPVQLAELVKSVPKGESDWLYEVKYDGYRILAYLEGSNVRLVTRNGNDYSDRFRTVTSPLTDWASGRAMVLDGEMVVTDAEGKSDFQALQGYFRNSKGKRLTYIIFDLLALEGDDLRQKPLIERKEILEALLKDSPTCLHYSKHIQGNGKECFAAAYKANLEGIVGKKVNSVYSGTRNGDWIKLKCDKRQEFVIGGYIRTENKTQGISSLLLGVYEGDELIYVGRSGTGFTDHVRKELELNFEGIERADSPFSQPPKGKNNEVITWLEPRLVAEIKFAQWTEKNLLRQASFKGIRTDKDPADVRMEIYKQPESPDLPDKKQLSAEDREKTMRTDIDSIIIGGVTITSPYKILFDDSGIKKADVVRYYEKVSQRMLPYVANRILSIIRCPKGICESCFFKKHPGPDNKGITVLPVTNSDGEKEDYFYIKDMSGLLLEAQMGTIEFHTWGSRIEELEKPDLMVFDLDPDEGMALEQVRQGVKDVKSILDQLSLTSYLKTSGGKGYHVVVPFKPYADWDTFHSFAKRVAELLEQKWPDRYTSNVRKQKRKNKIFIDWIRNGRGATSIAPYSLRARKGAKVSTPISWEELDSVAPDGVDMAGAVERISGDDPWKDFFITDQRLKF